VDRPVTDGRDAGLPLDVGVGVSLVNVDILCCLGDMFDADGGCGSAVTARVDLLGKSFVNTYPF